MGICNDCVLVQVYIQGNCSLCTNAFSYLTTFRRHLSVCTCCFTLKVYILRNTLYTHAFVILTNFIMYLCSARDWDRIRITWGNPQSGCSDICSYSKRATVGVRAPFCNCDEFAPFLKPL